VGEQNDSRVDTPASPFEAGGAPQNEALLHAGSEA